MNKRIKIKSSADIIKEKTRNNSEVISYVNDILETIEHAIEDSIEQEKKQCMVRVSSNFYISFMSEKQARMDIYYLVHQTLVQTGYIVNILYNGNTLYDSTETIFKIKWNTDYDKIVYNYKHEYLEKISKKINTNIN